MSLLENTLGLRSSSDLNIDRKQVRKPHHNVSLKFTSFILLFPPKKMYAFYRIRVLLSCTLEIIFGIFLINEFNDGIDLDKI